MKARKETRATGEYDALDQGRTVRLETRAGEFTAVASLRGSTPKAQGNRQARSPLRGEGRGPQRARSHGRETRNRAI